MSVRLRRLKADYDQICTVFGGDSKVRVVRTHGTPPEKYEIEFLVTGLRVNPDTRQVQTHNQFLAEIVLTAAYPRMAPQCRMLTPVFHPNIAPHAVCIGDHWAAGESLASLLVRMAEMLAYQSYNVKSPLNGEAARWVEQHADQVPLDNTDFAALLAVGQSTGRNADGSLAAGGECANCGRQASAGEMTVCINHHVTCADCRTTCPVCGGTTCLKCDQQACALCGRQVCTHCLRRCAACQRLACAPDAGVCVICQRPHCNDCLVTCAACGGSCCVAHVVKAEIEGRPGFVCTACATRAGVAAPGAAP